MYVWLDIEGCEMWMKTCKVRFHKESYFLFLKSICLVKKQFLKLSVSGHLDDTIATIFSKDGTYYSLEVL